MQDLVFKKLRAGDRLFVGIDSQEIWLKISLEMREPDTISFQSDFEIKIDLQTRGKDLKMCIQKLSINLWNQLCNGDRNMHSAITDEKNNGAMAPGQGPQLNTPSFNGACQTPSHLGYNAFSNLQTPQ